MLARLVLFLSLFCSVSAMADDAIEAELNAFWKEASRTVAEGDFKGYAATYHPDAVLVNDKTSYPISQALSGWKQGFDDTVSGKMQAGVSFRFSKRVHDDTTAHEKGMFHYYSIDADGKRNDGYFHMNALLVKKDSHWLMVMEHQVGVGTKAEWDASQ